MTSNLQIEIRDSLADIEVDAWNGLNDDGNPFLRHEFLHSLQATGCLGEATGWYPRYFLLWLEIDGGNELIAAVPTYIKTNSYGEFVFDFAWAEAYQNNQLDYYPKLVSSIPFTPATGRRLLIRADQPYEETLELLSSAIRQFADGEEFSGVHYLFVTKAESDALTATDHLKRMDCQYHWQNEDYTDFDDFLSRCTSKRRKTLRRERRHVHDAGLRLEQRLGDTLSEKEWRWVHRFYQSTFDRKWGNPSLTQDFFERVGRLMGKNMLIVFAYDKTDEQPEWPVACSIMFIGETTLYGRFWGCRAEYNSLHFEACYYQGIEYCINHSIKSFEPGAQGEHKITRGFIPTLTYSAHHIKHPGFRDAITKYLDQERQHVELRCTGLTDLLPFKSESISL
ncbi:MAG: putative N-acyltransferase [Granulosicoccus sp.]|jgi:predicted N-acyltransferase